MHPQHHLILCLALCAGPRLLAQEDVEPGLGIPVPEVDAVPDTVLTTVEVMPEFPGGMEALRRYLGTRIRYPHQEMDAGIEGRILLEFVVTKEGEIADVVVKRGVERGPGLAREAVRVVKSMPRWKPGMQEGRPVNTRFLLPVTFVLPKDEE